MQNNREMTVVQDVSPKPPARRKQMPIDLNRPRTINDVRHDNFKALVEQHGAHAVAKKMGLSSTTFISQMVGKTKWREVKENTVRSAETVFGLPYGSMDVDHLQPQVAKPETRPSGINTELLTEAMQQTADLCTESRVTLTAARHAALVSVVYADALEHGGTVRAGYIRQLLSFAG